MNRFQLKLHPLVLPKGLLLGFYCAVFVSLFMLVGWFNRLENTTLDLQFQAREPKFPDPRITVLVADDATVAQVGKWPLPRHVYADVVRRLDRSGVRTIVFDVLLTAPSSQRDDAELVNACRESKRVVQAVVFHVPQIYNPSLPASLVSAKRTPDKRFGISDRGAQCLAATWLSPALPALQESAPALGHVNVYPEVDGTLRRIPIIRYRGQVYPSLAIAGAANFLGVRPGEIIAGEGELEVAPADSPPRHLPLDAHGETLINWVGGNNTFPTYNFNQLLEGRVPITALKDRIVLVGITAAGAFESRVTPFSPMQPAIELQANAVDNILSNRPLHELPRSVHFILLYASSILAGLLIVPRRTLGGVLWVLALETVLWKGAVWALGEQNFYVPVAAPMVSILLVYGAASAMNYRQEWEANWRVDAAVAALARGGSLMASGRDRVSLLRVIRDTALEVLQASEVFLVLQPENANVQQDSSTSTSSSSTSPSSTPPSSTPPSSTLHEVTHLIGQNDQVVLWPGPSKPALHPAKYGPLRAREIKVAGLSPKLNSLLGRLNGEILESRSASPGRALPATNSIVAAPFVPGSSEVLEAAIENPGQHGVLLATGRSDGQPFSELDAALLATLADQASLALGNLEYYEVLRGRIDLANQDLRVAYQALEEERTKLVAAMESNESALIITDESHCALFFNSSTTRILSGLTLKQSVPEALEKQDMSAFAQLFTALIQDEVSIRETIQNGNPVAKYSSEIARFARQNSRPDPIRSILDAQLTVLVGVEGRQLGTMLVITDVTAQRDLGQMKDDFVSYVAHELRTPLNTINGYAYLLGDEELEFPARQRKEMLISIEEQCNRLNRIVNDLLDISGIEAVQEVQLNLTTLDLVPLCTRVLEDQRAAISDRVGITLELRCRLQTLWASVDADRLEQVLINLISNGIKYSPDGGTVVVDLSEQGVGEAREIKLKVSDVGMGMTAEQLSHLFQKYYRAPEAQMRGIKGSGLGLHLVKRLVEAHAGEIEVESHYQHGTTFTVTLPQLL